MGFRLARCHSCNKEIPIPDDSDTSLCMYCGARVNSQTVFQNTSQPTISNLLGLARTASISGNVEEAEKYYTRVLEIDPTISEAWIGKGKSAGWKSTLGNIRLQEMVIAFNHAITTASEDEKKTTILTCADEINSVAVTLYNMARDHMFEFIALPDTWTEYIGRVNQLLSALESIATWNPTNRTVLENIIHICSESIEGVTYRDPYDNDALKGWHLSSQYEELMREKIQISANTIKKIDPSYTPPAAQKKELSQVRASEGCFVVTATMGNPQHPYVILMRAFRDQWLLQRSSGRTFVKWYYRYGPKAADLISHSKRLRILSYVLLVRPAALLVRRLVK